jgi:hypothetical protein
MTLGTSNLILGYVGTHWFVAQVAAVMMMMFAILMALGGSDRPKQFFGSGIFWALSVLSRNHLVLAFPFFAQFALEKASPGASASSNPGAPAARRHFPLRINYRGLVLLVLPMVVAVLFLGWYNWARFGNVLDNGIVYHKMAPRFQADFKQYGYLSFHYVPRNFYYEMLRVPMPPHVHIPEPGPENTWREGYSLFFQCPLLLYALGTIRRVRSDKFAAACWLSIVCVTVPILCVMGTGWYQFGARYLFDVVPFYYLLTVVATRGRVTPLFLLLVILSIYMNFHGLHCWGYI